MEPLVARLQILASDGGGEVFFAGVRTQLAQIQ
jgi:hypothetical protein